MIDTGLFLSFVVVSSAVIVMPGPNVMVTIATSLTHGYVRGLQTVTGTLLAMAIQLYVAAAGTAVLAETLSEVFEKIRWAGVAYLLYLGITHVRAAVNGKDLNRRNNVSAAGSFSRGFVVGITNPKTILFFGAFLPQFTTSSLPIARQLLILSATFLLLALLFDSLYVLAASKAGGFACRPAFRRWLNAGAGSLLIGSSVGLAVARRT